MPSAEITPVYEHPGIPWDKEALTGVLDRGLSSLSSALYVPDNRNGDGGTYKVLCLPPHDKSSPQQQYVLRVELKYADSQQRLHDELLEYRRELQLLGAEGVLHGINQVVIPHSVFAEAQNNWQAPGQQKIYTVADKVDGGKNMRRQLTNPVYQNTLLAIGNTLANYYINADPALTGGPCLADVSSHYQWSRTGRLYDTGYDLSRDLVEIGDEIDDLREWAQQLLPSSGKEALLGKAAEAAQMYAVDY